MKRLCYHIKVKGMKKYTTNEVIALKEGLQWQVNEATFTCVKFENVQGLDTYFLEVTSPEFPGKSKNFKITWRDSINAIDFYNTYTSFKDIL